MSESDFTAYGKPRTSAAENQPLPLRGGKSSATNFNQLPCEIEYVGTLMQSIREHRARFICSLSCLSMSGCGTISFYTQAIGGQAEILQNA